MSTTTTDNAPRRPRVEIGASDAAVFLRILGALNIAGGALAALLLTGEPGNSVLAGAVFAGGLVAGALLTGFASALHDLRAMRQHLEQIAGRQ